MRRLLRNCALEQLAGFAVEEREAEMGGTLAQAVKDADAVLGIVGGGAGILVHQALPEDAYTRIASLRAVAVMALALPTR